MNVDSVTLRGWWLWIKQLLARVAIRKSDPPATVENKPTPARRHRTTAFFEMP